MSSEMIDLTLPAHDPTIPKPRGLLPVPPEIEEGIAAERRGFNPILRTSMRRSPGIIGPCDTTTRGLKSLPGGRPKGSRCWPLAGMSA